MELQTKVCTQCRQEKPRLDFPPLQKSSDGLYSWCRACKNARNAEWYRKTAPAQLAKQRERYRTDDAYRAAHLERTRERHRKTFKPQQHRAGHLRRNYGLTEDEYDEMVERQGGVCAVCRQPETAVEPRSGRPRLLSVDHDHATGAVRGLLCRKCNSALGLLRENADLVARLLAYVLRDEAE